jgi:hypothetical protein
MKLCFLRACHAGYVQPWTSLGVLRSSAHGVVVPLGNKLGSVGTNRRLLTYEHSYSFTMCTLWCSTRQISSPRRLVRCVSDSVLPQHRRHTPHCDCNMCNVLVPHITDMLNIFSTS